MLAIFQKKSVSNIFLLLLGTTISQKKVVLCVAKSNQICITSLYVSCNLDKAYNDGENTLSLRIFCETESLKSFKR